MRRKAHRDVQREAVAVILAGLPPEVPDPAELGEQVAADPPLAGAGFWQELALPGTERLDEPLAPGRHRGLVDLPFELPEGALPLGPGDLDRYPDRAHVGSFRRFAAVWERAYVRSSSQVLGSGSHLDRCRARDTTFGRLSPLGHKFGVVSGGNQAASGRSTEPRVFITLARSSLVNFHSKGLAIRS